MKKVQLLLLVMMMLGFYTSVLGQESRFALSLEAGGTLGNLRGNRIVEEHKAFPGFFGGLGFEYKLTDAFSVKLNPAFERKSTVMRFDVQGIDDEDRTITHTYRAVVRHHFNYLTVPLLARATFGDEIKYFVNAGPYAAYLLSYTVAGNDINSNSNKKIRMNDTNAMKQHDAGATVGAGVVYPFRSNFLLTAELRGNRGFVDINRNKSPLGTNKLSSINLILGLVKL